MGIGRIVVILASASSLFAQTPALSSIVNAASFQPSLSPGSLAVVTGLNFAPNVSVHFGATTISPLNPAQVGSSQFSILIPAGINIGVYQATVSGNGGTSAPITIILAQASPAFATIGNTSPPAYFYDSTLTPVSLINPARSGASVATFVNGLGPNDGKQPVSNATLPVSVNFSRGAVNQDAVIDFAGFPPGLTGSGQVNLTIPSGLAQGVYDVTISVGGIVSPRIQFPIGGPVITAVQPLWFAQKTVPVAPGSVIWLFGSSLANADKMGIFPETNLPGGGSITINGIKAPLFDVRASSGQVTALAPYELPESGTVPVMVTNSFGVSQAFQLAMAPYAPSFLKIPDPANKTRLNAAALISGTAWRAFPNSMASALGIPSDCRLNNVSQGAVCGQPASRGDILEIYVTGLGKATPDGDPRGDTLTTGMTAPADGHVLYRTVATPVVMIGDVAADVMFSGIAPGTAGTYQLNVTIPSAAPLGDDIVIRILMPGGATDSATIAIK